MKFSQESSIIILGVKKEVKLITKIGCKDIVEDLKTSIKEEVQRFSRAPFLAVIQVEGNPASDVYVRKKAEMCEELGIAHHTYLLRDSVTTVELTTIIDSLNRDDTVDGILVQLPLPDHIDTNRVIDSISVEKDVDGFSVATTGLLSQGRPNISPCTPYGIIHALKTWGVVLRGKQVTIIGRSNIVGKPLASMMLNEDATVSICHSKTDPKLLKSFCRSSDVVVLAVGKPKLIDSSYIKDGAWVVDVGVNRIPDASKKTGYKLVGDFDYEDTSERNFTVTKVPGGVGLMTVISLMKNTVQCAFNRRGY